MPARNDKPIENKYRVQPFVGYDKEQRIIIGRMVPTFAPADALNLAAFLVAESGVPVRDFLELLDVVQFERHGHHASTKIIR